MLQSPQIVFPVTNWVPNYNNTYYTSNVIQQILGTVSVPVGLPDNALLTVAYAYNIQRNNKGTTTSTDVLTIGLGTVSLTVGTGLSILLDQDIVIAYNNSNRMEGTVLSYNSGTGALSANITLIIGSGTYTDWTVTPFTYYSLAGIIAGTTTPYESDVAWSFNSSGYISLQENDVLTLRFKALEFINNIGSIGAQIDESDPVDLIANIVNINEIQASAGIPSGTFLKTFKNSIKILIPKDSILVNIDSSFLGCNFYISLDPGGGASGYQLMNNTYVTAPDDSETVSSAVTQSDITNQADGLIVETTKNQQVLTEYYTYTIDKTVLQNLVDTGAIANVFLSDNTTINSDITYYFVTTSVAYDTVLNTTVESFQSLELEGKFLYYNTDFRGLPVRKRQDILFTMSRRMLADNNLVNIVTGQVIRDTIDPVTEMFENFYVIQDFVFRCLSIDSLLAFDDVNNTGVSDPVSSSILKTNLKTALGVTDDDSLQNLIDEQFDKQAANFNLTRKVAAYAKGSVVFYTTKMPVSDILIADGTTVTYPGNLNLNIAPVNYTVIGNNTMQASTINNYYNASKQRWELQADIIAVATGSDGNVPAETITVVAGLDPSIQVENLIPTEYGSDEESNHDLSARIKLARPSFDSGTKPGYTEVAYSIPGVLEVNVQEAGDPLMIRDVDTTTLQHIGGKVDIYIRGSGINQVIDQLAFKFEHPSDVLGNQVGEVFYVIDASDFRIKTTNPKVTNNTPIVVVNQIRNVTRGKDYDLTDIGILSDTLILSSTSQTNINIGMAAFDVIEVDYEYRSSNVLILENQPVIDIISVADKDGNVIEEVDPTTQYTNYRIIQRDDPLMTGNSTIAGYGIEFLFNSDNAPSPITITAEQHSIRLNQPAQLNFKGIVLDSIVVMSSDQTITYKIGVDYTITLGNQQNYTFINLISNGMIRSGDIITVNYEASPNLFITYTYNSLVSQAQDSVDTMKHACADAIVKNAINNMIDLSFNVERDLSIMVSSSGVPTDDENRLRSRIQTAIFNAVSGLKMGQTLTQSYLLKAILAVTGVESVSMPFIIMQKRAGSFISLDDLGYLSFAIFQKSNNTGIVSYITINPVLTYSTTDNGGPNNMFRMVYENMQELVLVTDPTLVSTKAGQAYIQSDGRIVVSTTDGSPPQSKYYKASYFVAYPVGVTSSGDIATSEIEYLGVDSLSFIGIDFTN